MDHAETVGKLPILKYDTDLVLNDIGALVDRLAVMPAGHADADHLAQQIKSGIDKVRSHIAEIVPETEEARPVVGEPVEEPVDHDHVEDRDPRGWHAHEPDERPGE